MTNFVLNQDYKLSLTEIDNMLPYERDIFLQLIIGRLEQEQQSKQGIEDSMPTKKDYR